MHFEIFVKDYVFSIVISYYCKGQPSRTWGKPEDCYEGESTYIGWQCESVEEYFEEGDSKILLAGQFESIVEEYAELIEEKIFAEIEEMRDDDFDYPDEY